MSSVSKPGPVGVATQPTLPKGASRVAAEQETSTPVKKSEENSGIGNLREFLGDLGYDAKATRLEFAADPVLDRVVVRVLDRESGDVIREIPPEEMLQVAKIMRKLMETNDALKGNLIRVVT